MNKVIRDVRISDEPVRIEDLGKAHLAVRSLEEVSWDVFASLFAGQFSDWLGETRSPG